MSLEHLATCRYYDRTFNCDAMRVLPGEYYVSKSNQLLMTVLGSCMAACIWDKKRGIGGLNHFMLPGEGDTESEKLACYGHYAMDILIHHIIQHGGKREDLVAKVFGAGQIMHAFKRIDIGTSNRVFIINYLSNKSIPLLASDLGGRYPRKICFFPKTGRVMVHKLASIGNDDLEKQERHYFAEMNSCDDEIDKSN